MRISVKALAFCLMYLIKMCEVVSQEKTIFDRIDTLRGSIGPARAWWDLRFYDLRVEVFPDQKSIAGRNTIVYRPIKAGQVMQLDLQPPMRIEKIIQQGKTLSFTTDGPNVYYVQLIDSQKVGKDYAIEVHYSGAPRVAKRAPWDGGFSWKKDSEGQHFVATSCQGLGASMWWPCKDHMYDEPDSMSIAVTVPEGLTDVSNGRLRRRTKNKNKTETFEWFVQNPINNYGVNLNVGNYAAWSDIYQGENGKLDLNYYVLPENKNKAQKQFAQVKQMLKAFEHWFGPYPFYQDGFKLVEVPYLGMEHQSSVTYGNRYQNGYLGTDLSGTGWGLKWDFIIIHESGHEWFANNITYQDIADMWIHESFTNYSESLFTEYYYGKKAGDEYVIGTRKNILNDEPIIGKYGVNHSGSGDMYYKGGNMLHTIRQIIDDDQCWRKILRGLNKDFYHQTVTSQQIEQYIQTKSGKNLQAVFDQYLRTTDIPTLEMKLEEGQIYGRWTTCLPNFQMPVRVFVGAKSHWLFLNTSWVKTSLKTSLGDIKLDDNFYIKIKK
jgi:aminopeptidase N